MAGLCACRDIRHPRSYGSRSGSGHRAVSPRFLTLSADAEDALGNVERVHRELLLRRSALIPVEAEACYDRAVNMAGAHQAKSWTPREATNTSQKWLVGVGMGNPLPSSTRSTGGSPTVRYRGSTKTARAIVMSANDNRVSEPVLAAGLDAEFAVHIAQMILDRLLAHLHLRSDLPVGQTFFEPEQRRLVLARNRVAIVQWPCGFRMLRGRPATAQR